MDLYGIFGAGGFGREVMPVACEMLVAALGTQGYELVFVVENLERETVVNGKRVISDSEFISQRVGGVNILTSRLMIIKLVNV